MFFVFNIIRRNRFIAQLTEFDTNFISGCFVGPAANSRPVSFGYGQFHGRLLNGFSHPKDRAHMRGQDQKATGFLVDKCIIPTIFQSGDIQT